MKHLITTIALMLVASTAQAACLPPLNTATLTPKWVVSDNARGCWAGWYCGSSLYIAAATKQQCSLVGVKRATAAWLTDPTTQALTFGTNPHTDPILKAVWEPERAKLDAIK